ncbi:acetyltransferase [Magnetospirillum sp. SS-4]|uniref:acetyltransferase n=1 Tax=Magnetospirillum sp. SS-4 TaxID=2681465 RepID=UPI00137E6114|nr:acetyltransferase [Magnetospirillum sp. SS-4]CAA7614389.1 Carbonic anhydrase [Magnetospirillum sp. SS-4]
MSTIVIVGAGGHGKVLADALLARGEAVAGFVDADSRLHGQTVLGLPVLGGDDRILPGWLLVNGIGSVADPGLRMRVERSFGQRGFCFLTVIHPAASVARGVSSGEGCQIMAGAVIQADATLGRGVIVNTRASVDHDCRLGDFVHIAPGATLSGGVDVGEASHIGTGAVVVEGVRIGRGCLVAAGAVVVREVPDGARVAGLPARAMTP